MNIVAKLMVATSLLATPALAADDPRVTAEIVALARSQWASEAAGQSAEQQMASVADDYTEFNGDGKQEIGNEQRKSRFRRVRRLAGVDPNGD